MKPLERSTFAWLWPLSILMASLTPRDLMAQALPTAAGPGSYLVIGGEVSAFQEDYGQQVIGGGTAYLDGNPTWRYGLEAEVRFLRYHTDEQVTETTYVIGPRVQLWHPSSRLHPYVKFLAGAGKISLPYQFAHGTFLAYAPGGGCDISFGERWSLRAVDFEYQLWPRFPYGALHPYGISAGLGFRINGMEIYPKNGRQVHR